MTNVSVSGAPPAATRAAIETAARVVPFAWGLDTVVAVTPLHAFEDQPFEDAIGQALDLYGARGYAEAPLEPMRRAATALERHGTGAAAPVVDALLGDWCAAWLAAPEPDGAAPVGLLSFWRARAVHDPVLRRWVRAATGARRTGAALRARIAGLPEDPDAMVDTMLVALRVAPDERVAYLEAALARLPGWSSLMVRRVARGHGDDLAEYVAIRLACEVLAGQAGVVSVAPGADQPPPSSALQPSGAGGVTPGAAALAAGEDAHRDAFLGLLASGTATPSSRPDAQIVCCIDPRSEGLRRHLELLGQYETLGFAGFFALPIAVQPIDADQPVASCPVLLEPRTVVREIEVGASGSSPHGPEAYDLFDAAKRGATSSFILADAAGWVLGPAAAVATFVPGAIDKVAGRLRARRPAPVTRYAVDAAPGHGEAIGLSDDAEIQVAHTALTTMGLTDRFAPLVVLCGHGSHNRNNPYRSALDCGACGGNPGGPNARILAAICNRPVVRAALGELGITIDDDVWFVAALHETTDDVVEVLDRDLVPESHVDALAALESDLGRALAANRAERATALPDAPRAIDPAGRRPRSADPTLVVPEWGLARNAALVIAPRSSTLGLDLERRVFLHSYDPAADLDGRALETIVTGPLVVAHWISSQYYFSTVDPIRFGAGTKPLHNVVERVGVYEGPSGDLRIGLPLESVSADGRPVHQPLRLLVVIEAPLDRIDAVLERNPGVRRLVENGWIRMAARPRPGDGFSLQDRSGAWLPWEPADRNATHDAQFDHDAHLDPEIGAPHAAIG